MKCVFSTKQHISTRRNNSLHPGYLASLVTSTNHNTIQTIGIYVRVFRTADHAGQIFIPHRPIWPPKEIFVYVSLEKLQSKMEDKTTISFNILACVIAAIFA